MIGHGHGNVRELGPQYEKGRLTRAGLGGVSGQITGSMVETRETREWPSDRQQESHEPLATGVAPSRSSARSVQGPGAAQGRRRGQPTDPSTTDEAAIRDAQRTPTSRSIWPGGESFPGTRNLQGCSVQGACLGANVGSSRFTTVEGPSQLIETGVLSNFYSYNARACRLTNMEFSHG